jgi:SAM-dependent methyltransferase
MTNDHDHARARDHAGHDDSADQRRWARPGSATATNWIAQDERMDRMHAAFGDRALERAALQPGEVVIDAGCGTGPTTLAAWQAVAPTGTVLGIDVSADMLDRARTRCAQAPGISLVQADAQDYSFRPAHADAVISRFGVAHFADTTTAFANLRAALRPGGRIAFAEWGPEADNVWMTLVGTVARRVLPAAALRSSRGHGHGNHQHGDHQHRDQEHGADGPGTHGHAPEFADAASIRAALEAAGWEDVQVDLVTDRAWLGSSPAEIVDWVFATELPSQLRLLDRVLLHRFRSALTGELSSFTDGDGVRLPSAAWLVAATNPSTPTDLSRDPS